jgi:hypothetical protein
MTEEGDLVILTDERKPMASERERERERLEADESNRLEISSTSVPAHTVSDQLP